MACTNDLTNAFGIWMCIWLTGPSKSFFPKDKKRQSRGVDRRFLRFSTVPCRPGQNCPCVAALTRGSRRNLFFRGAISTTHHLPLPFGNEHTAMKHDRRDQG